MTAALPLSLGLGTKMPLILQSEASECGLACLTMIARHFGCGTELVDLRRRFGTSLKGATLKDLVRFAEILGLSSRPLRLELNEIDQLRLPCVVHWDLNHFVVLQYISQSTVTVYDPAVGVRKLSNAEFSRHFTGIALELLPNKKFVASEKAPRVGISQLLGQMKGVRSALLNLLALAFVVEIFAIISPLFLSWVVDDAVVSGDQDLLTTLLLGFTALLILQVSVSAMRSWILMGLNASLKLQSQSNLFGHLINLPASFFDARHIADVMSRFGSQETILRAITSELIEALLDGVMTVVTLIVMFMIAPTLAWIAVGGALLYALLRWLSFVPLRQASAEEIIWTARRDTHFLETVRGIRTVKIYNTQEDRRVYWLNLLVETINRRLTAEKLSLAVRTAKAFLAGMVNIIVIWLGAYLVLEGQLSVGLLLAFVAYKNLFLQRVGDLTNRAVDLRMLLLHAERLADIALTAPELRDPVTLPFGENRNVSVELKNVSFRYSENEPLVLDNVSFRVERGQSVAIIGGSGCGKTTLLKILCGLLTPTSGEILVNEEPVARFGISNYRSMLGVVLQDDSMFAGSIADNITFFADRPSRDYMECCAKAAAIHDDILAMPMGYGTLIGDMGTVLSGGQRQRILIARALYRCPALLLLDEATSHLDVERERLVNEALKQTSATRIVIAHRPETIRSSDRIIRLHEGKVVEEESAPRMMAIACR